MLRCSLKPSYLPLQGLDGIDRATREHYKGNAPQGAASAAPSSAPGRWSGGGERMRRRHSELWKDLREGLASLMLCNLGDYVSGALLHFFKPLIEKAPIILALLPAASDARGDVYSSYGSRLGTLLHLGLYRRHIREELEALLVLVVIVNAWIGVLVAALGRVLGNASLSLLDAVFISLLSALVSAVFMVPATTWLASYSFRRGLDPDNLVAPIATLFGDVVTIPSIVAGYLAAARLPQAVKAAVSLLLLSVALLLLTRLLRRGVGGRAARILRENLTIILLATLLSGLAGAFLVDNLTRLLDWPGVLVVVPAFLEDGGAVAVRLSSKLTTRLHLGSLHASCHPDRWVAAQLLVSLVVSLPVFISLGFLGAATALLSGSPGSWAARVFAAVLAAGLTLSLIVSLISYCLAIASFRLGVDPDNVLAPILTSVADMLGVMTLVVFVAAIT